MNLDKLTKPQIIKKGNIPEFAVIPYQEYQTLLEAFEELEDIHDYKKSLSVEDESVLVEVLDRLLAGENSIKVWRDYRGLSRKDLAKAGKISVPYLCLIEQGERTPSLKTISSLAKLLQVSIEDEAH
jgi:DNA-binding XRE family transcriptional regulator